MAETMLDKAVAAAWPFLWDAADTSTPSHDAARARMRAALQAIREPSQEMIYAGNDEDGYFADGTTFNADCEKHWGAMIDAILSEGKA